MPLRMRRTALGSLLQALPANNFCASRYGFPTAIAPVASYGQTVSALK